MEEGIVHNCIIIKFRFIVPCWGGWLNKIMATQQTKSTHEL